MHTALPKHIAIIMDGNGRWAKERGLLRIQGHREGVKTVRRVIEECSRLGIEQLTLYAFSKENWRRPSKEVLLLMRLLQTYARLERNNLKKENVRLNVIGRADEIPAPARNEIQKTITATAECTGLQVNLALSYGGRDEILRAACELHKKLQAGELQEEDLKEEEFSKCLDTSGIPDPDLVIRTSGEQRISNFLLWQTAYSELVFTERLWPEFSDSDLHNAIEEYLNRERRYGRVSDENGNQEPRKFGEGR